MGSGQAPLAALAHAFPNDARRGAVCTKAKARRRAAWHAPRPASFRTARRRAAAAGGSGTHSVTHPILRRLRLRPRGRRPTSAADLKPFVYRHVSSRQCRLCVRLNPLAKGTKREHNGFTDRNGRDSCPPFFKMSLRSSPSACSSSRWRCGSAPTEPECRARRARSISFAFPGCAASSMPGTQGKSPRAVRSPAFAPASLRFPAGAPSPPRGPAQPSFGRSRRLGVRRRGRASSRGHPPPASESGCYPPRRRLRGAFSRRARRLRGADPRRLRGCRPR